VHTHQALLDFSKCIQTSLLDEYHPCLCGKELFIYEFDNSSEVKIDPKEFGSSYENIYGRK
jgi:hypothetical protein